MFEQVAPESWTHFVIAPDLSKLVFHYVSRLFLFYCLFYAGLSWSLQNVVSGNQLLKGNRFFPIFVWWFDESFIFFVCTCCQALKYSHTFSFLLIRSITDWFSLITYSIHRKIEGIFLSWNFWCQWLHWLTMYVLQTLAVFVHVTIFNLLVLGMPGTECFGGNLGWFWNPFNHIFYSSIFLNLIIT